MISDLNGVTGLAIVRAIVAGERDQFLGITIRKDATPICILQRLLEQAGMKLDCVRKAGGRGEQVRIYRLSLAQWQLAQEVLEFRRLKRERQAQQSVERLEGSVVTGGFLHIDINKRGAGARFYRSGG